MSFPPAIGLNAREPSPDLSDLRQRLDELEDLGLAFVELPTYALDLVIGGRILPGRMAELEAACRTRPFRFTVHGPLAINVMGPPEHLAAFTTAARAFLEISARIAAPHLVLHAGMLLPEEVPELDRRLAQQREVLASLGDEAAALGVALCVENLFDFDAYRWTPSLACLAREIAAIGHPAIRATFDISHGLIHARQTGYDFLEEAESLAPLAAHLHLHDSFGEPDLPWVYAPAEAAALGMGDLHLPVGWGDVPWVALAERCRFPSGAIAIHELNPRFWRDRHEAVGAAGRVAAMLLGQDAMKPERRVG